MDGLAEKLLLQGYQARRNHRLAEARLHFANAADLCRAIDVRALLVQALCGVGQIERDMGHLEAAIRPYEEAVGICRTLDQPLALAHTLRHLADILRNEGSLDAAAPHYREALEIYRCHAPCPPLDLANAIRGFALLKASLRETLEAKQLWQEARDLYAQVGVEAGVSEAERQIAHLGN